MIHGDLVLTSQAFSSIEQEDVGKLCIHGIGYKAGSLYKNDVVIQSGEYIRVDDPWDRTTASHYCKVQSFLLIKVC